MEWTLTCNTSRHTLTLGTAAQEATSFSIQVGPTKLTFRWDRAFHTLYQQDMREGFLIETPFPVRRWEQDPQTGAFICEIRIGSQYRTLYGSLRPSAVETLLQKSVSTAGPAPVVSPMTGVVLRIEVVTGATVQPGQVLAVLDAMKMENQILGKQVGIIEKVHVSPGENVHKGTRLFTLSAP